ncbi:MAG: hypothetical protein ABJB33_04295 [Gemmatimonadota bacterium]
MIHWVGAGLRTTVVKAIRSDVAAQVGVTFEVLAYVDVNAESDSVQRLARQVVEPGASLGVFTTVAEAERWMRAKGSPRA